MNKMSGDVWLSRDVPHLDWLTDVGPLCVAFWQALSTPVKYQRTIGPRRKPSATLASAPKPMTGIVLKVTSLFTSTDEPPEARARSSLPEPNARPSDAQALTRPSPPTMPRPSNPQRVTCPLFLVGWVELSANEAAGLCWWPTRPMPPVGCIACQS